MTEKNDKHISIRSFIAGIAAIDLTIASCSTIPAAHCPVGGGPTLGFQTFGAENA